MNLFAVDQHLAAQILHFDQSAFESHHQAALELVLGTVQFHRGDAPAVVVCRAQLQLARDDVRDARRKRGVHTRRDAKQPRVRVAVMEGGTVVHAVVLVEHVGIKAAVHALPGAARGKAATAAQQHLQRRKCVNVVIVNRQTFVRNVHMRKLGRRVRQHQLAAGVPRALFAE